MPLISVISRIPQRWVICLLCSLALATISFKNTIFFEIYNIVESFTALKKGPVEGCPYFHTDHVWERKELPFYLPAVYWNPLTLEISQSALNVGKILAVVPAGLLADLGYSRYVLGGGMAVIVGCHLLLPITAELGFFPLVISSLVEGVGEATIYPCVIRISSHWAPPSKRNTFIALILTGTYYGNTLGHIMFQINYKKFNSWSFSKISSSSLGIVWLIFWYIFGYHAPNHSPFVNVTSSQRPTLVQRFQKLHSVPWRKIICSRPFTSVVLLYCSLKWAFYSNLDAILESYEEHILHLPERFSEGTSIVVSAALPTLLIGGCLTDWILKNKVTSKTVINRIFAFQSVFWSSVLMVMSTFVGCNYIMFWILIGMAVYPTGLADSAIYTSPFHLSYRHAGLLMGIMDGARTILSLFTLTITEGLVPDPTSSSHWSIMALFYAVVALVMMIPFLIVGSAERQHWDRQRRRFVSTSPRTELSNSERPNHNDDNIE